MKHARKPARRARPVDGRLVAACVLSGALSVGIALWPAASVSAATDDPITLNFKDAEIDSVVGAFGHLLNRTFIIDPRVRGKMTLETPRPVSRAQAFELLQAALRMQGFAIVQSGELTKVVPEADAKLQSGPVSAISGGKSGARGDQIVTQIFRLQYESATNLVPVIRPLISPNNTVTAYPNNNSLVVTDYAANVDRLARIIAGLDAPSTSEVEVVPVKHTLATDVAVSLARLIDDSARVGGGGGAAPTDAGQRVTVLADPRLNAVMVRAASPARMNLAKSLINRLDQPSSTPGNIYVVYLRNAEAVRLAQVLRGVLTGGQGTGTGTGQTGYNQTQTGMSANTTNTAFGQQTQTAGTFGTQQNSSLNTPLQQQSTMGTNQSNMPQAIVAGGAVIAADPATNSLIITAPEPLYRNLRTVIDRLDARRAQIYIESLIVEVEASRAAELGVQWQFLDQGRRVVGGTNFNGSTGGGNIIGAAVNNMSNLGTGLNLGVINGSVTIGGQQILNLGLLASALETNSGANILATPNLLTLDNEEARIIIGQNVPFITGQYSTPTASTAGTAFQTIERKDVGTVLRVRPQVSEAGTVKLQIFQEVSSVSDTSLAAGLITNRRAIESNVLVDDGQMVVLGGLIEDRVEGGQQKVPGLGSLPLIGQLFRYDNRKHTKTNLMVFLRPRILRDSESSYNVSTDRYDYIRQLQGDTRLPQHWALPEFDSPALANMSPRPPSGPTRGVAPPMMEPIPDNQSPTYDMRASRQPGAAAVAPATTAPAAVAVPAPAPIAPAAPAEAAAVPANAVPAPIVRSSPTMIQTAPNEVLVPLNREIRTGPAEGPTLPPTSPPAGEVPTQFVPLQREPLRGR